MPLPFLSDRFLCSPPSNSLIHLGWLWASDLPVSLSVVHARTEYLLPCLVLCSTGAQSQGFILARQAHSTHSKNFWNVSNGSEYKDLWVMGKRVSRWMRLRHQHCTNETGLCLPWEDTEDTQVWLDKHPAWGRDRHPLKHRNKSTQTQ